MPNILYTGPTSPFGRMTRAVIGKLEARIDRAVSHLEPAAPGAAAR